MSVLTMPTTATDRTTTTTCPIWCRVHEFDPTDGTHIHTAADTLIVNGDISTATTGLYRIDEPGTDGDARVSICVGDDGLTPAAAARLAFVLRADALTAAGLTGIEVDASEVQIGWQYLSPNGWQTVTGVMAFASPPLVSIFTVEQNDTDTDGWQLTPDDAVRIREVPA
jgi:hypothetical protein